ncbi:hypothetical protein EVJ58_g9846 [Rhodofomes roseus]|uniref:Phosphatidylglycerol/phosphatidylinositol transfer protein n=1 Tax=Rhodofomes roseus TaxID=34475 RepID=A0A4Y9XTM7_9APHY|nr:hypothetical protein EVJ58_g9846 [Rhodofomes roseus]
MARLGFFVLVLSAIASLSGAVPTEEQVALAAPGDWSWKDCGGPSHLIRIDDIAITPDPPQKGQEMSVTVKGTAKDQIEDGAYVDVVVKVGAIKILQKEFDVCEEARNANASIQCPVQEGKHEVTQTVDLPKEIPPAPFKVSIRGYTVDDEDLACVDIEIDFRPKRGLLGLSW